MVQHYLCHFATSMTEKGQPDIAPEGWVDFMRDIMDKAVADGKLVYASKSLSDGGVQGWWIPKYLADAHPDIKTIDDALKHPELFPAPENSSKGAVFNGPPGWGGTVAIAQFFKAYDAEKKGFSRSSIRVLQQASMARWQKPMSARKAGSDITGNQPPSSGNIRW